jgi:hypothetical protein
MDVNLYSDSTRYTWEEQLFLLKKYIFQVVSHTVSWILGSVYWVTDPDLDPDSALFISGFNNADKK